MTARNRSGAEDSKIRPAVAETVRALLGEERDAALLRLCERYAAEIDAAQSEDPPGAREALARLGPLLLAALVQAGATPAARAAALKGGQPNVPSAGASALERLRATRQAARPA